MTKEQLEKITRVLSDPKNFNWFINTYGKGFVKGRDNCIAGRLRFDMRIDPSVYNCELNRKIIQYNNDIINLFYNDPDFGKGFIANTSYCQTNKYPITCSCVNKSMYIYCMNMILDPIGCKTQKIIGMILGYVEIPNYMKLGIWSF